MPLTGLQKYYSGSKMLLCGLFLIKELSVPISRSEARGGVGLQCLQPHSSVRIWKNFWCLKLQRSGLPSGALYSLLPEAHSELFVLTLFSGPELSWRRGGTAPQEEE